MYLYSKRKRYAKKAALCGLFTFKNAVSPMPQDFALGHGLGSRLWPFGLLNVDKYHKSDKVTVFES